MELYNAIMNVANAMNCTFNEAFMWCTFSLMVFFALIGWAISFCMEYGMTLFEVTKRLFRFLRGFIRRL